MLSQAFHNLSLARNLATLSEVYFQDIKLEHPSSNTCQATEYILGPPGVNNLKIIFFFRFSKLLFSSTRTDFLSIAEKMEGKNEQLVNTVVCVQLEGIPSMSLSSAVELLGNNIPIYFFILLIYLDKYLAPPFLFLCCCCHCDQQRSHPGLAVWL